MTNLSTQQRAFIRATARHIATFLQDYIANIEDHYQWSFKLEDVPAALNFSVQGLDNWYAKTVHLKACLVERLAACTSYEQRFVMGEYFVKKWGGVGTNVSLYQTLEPYDDVQLLENISKFAGISSWSKYLSLRNGSAAIYDSRVAYAINVINYLAGNKSCFFPMPAGRSPKLALLDIETLFLLDKLSGQEKIITDTDLTHAHISSRVHKKFYLPKKTTYSAYLSLLDLIAEELGLEQADKHKIEMLLFALAPTVIFERLITEKSQRES